MRCVQLPMWSVRCRVCRPDTSPHLFIKRIDEHHYSAISKHSNNDHALETKGDLTNNFSVLKKCNVMECLIYEMLLMKKKCPCLNTQSDSLCIYKTIHLNLSSFTSTLSHLCVLSPCMVYNYYVYINNYF